MDEIDTLTRKAVAGDEDALSTLLKRHGPDVERSLTIQREWRSVLEPADIMQVTYLEAFLQISRFDADRSQFQTWLRRIAGNNLRDAIRGLQRQKRPQPADRVESGDDRDGSLELVARLGVATTTPSRVMARDERDKRLNALLDMLPEDYARVVRLYDLDGLPVADVARRMARSPGAVHMLRARAHDRLHEILDAESAWFTSGS